jgi:hypothetical protein
MVSPHRSSGKGDRPRFYSYTFSVDDVIEKVVTCFGWCKGSAPRSEAKASPGPAKNLMIKSANPVETARSELRKGDPGCCGESWWRPTEDRWGILEYVLVEGLSEVSAAGSTNPAFLGMGS